MVFRVKTLGDGGILKWCLNIIIIIIYNICIAPYNTIL